MAEKKTHKEAGYRTSTLYPKRYCGNCTMFRDRPTGRCTLVEDPIEHGAWCKFHDPKRDEGAKAA